MVWIYKASYEKKTCESKRELEQRLGRELLIKGLKERYGIEVDENRPLNVGKEKQGKPYLVDYPQIHYNISHCDGMVVCAIGDEIIGVDVESLRPYKELILPKVLSVGEQKQLAMTSEERREEKFFRFWTLKESWVKALGCGIRIQLTEIEFKLEETGEVKSSVKGWYFRQIMLADRVILAICTSEKGEIKIMRKVRMMMQSTCPHCKRALGFMEELKNEHPEYGDVEVEIVDENKNKELAETLDYWYVPTFFVDGEKVHEGVPTKEKVQQVYIKALEA